MAIPTFPIRKGGVVGTIEIYFDKLTLLLGDETTIISLRNCSHIHYDDGNQRLEIHAGDETIRVKLLDPTPTLEELVPRMFPAE